MLQLRIYAATGLALCVAACASAPAMPSEEVMAAPASAVTPPTAAAMAAEPAAMSGNPTSASQAPATRSDTPMKMADSTLGPDEKPVQPADQPAMPEQPAAQPPAPKHCVDLTREPSADPGTGYPGGRWKVPEATYGTLIEQDVRIMMSDGVALVGDVSYPADLSTRARASGEFPVILTQNPYGAGFGADYGSLFVPPR